MKDTKREAELLTLLHDINGRTHGLTREMQALAARNGYRWKARPRLWDMMRLKPMQLWVLRELAQM